MIETYANSAVQVFAGNVSLEAAANWVVKHENKPDSDQMPLLLDSFKKPEVSKPSLTKEDIKEKQQFLRESCKKKEEEDRQPEKEKEKSIMGKKVKKKTRSGQKDKRVASASPVTVPELGPSNTEIPDDGVAGIKDRGLCSHIDRGTNLDNLSGKLRSSESLKCEDCRGNAVDRRAKKGKGKHGKKGLTSKSESKAIWICLECGYFSCGGVGLPTTPQSHAVRHAKQKHHPLVVHYKNHQLVWCFPCNKLIPAEKSEDNKLKVVLNEVVKLLKDQPGEGSTVDVEDVWFGSGSVTSAIKSDYSSSIGADGRAGYSVRGLVNLGNTCFFNSVMQNLLAINSLRGYFFKLDESVGSLSAALRKLFVETSTEAVLKGVISPRSLFGSLCTKAPQFRGYQQHDSHELLRCLLDGLSTEELSARKHTKSSEVSIAGPTFVDAIFGGQLSSTVSCLECGHSSTTYEPFLDLSLPVPTKKPPVRKSRQITQGKKPKLPPKRSGRNLSKISREPTPSGGKVSDQSTSGNSLGEVQSTTHPAEQVVLSSGDSALSDCPDPNTIALDMGLTSQDLSVVQKPKNEQAVENAGDQDSWLDYLEPHPVSHDTDIASETDEVSAMQVLANEDALQNDVSLSVTLDSNAESDLGNALSTTRLGNCSHNNALEPGVLAQQEDGLSQYEDESNEKPQITERLCPESFSGEEVHNDADIGHGSDSCDPVCAKDPDTSGRDERNPLAIQTSGVILLPYKEDASSSVEVLQSEIEVSLAVLDDNQGSLDFDGFGDLFNEPEVSVEVKHPVSGATKNGVAGNSSESDPDEVDNADVPVSVESCLAFFTKPEFLSKDEHAWQCDNCSKVLREQKYRLRKKLQMPKSENVPNGYEDMNQNGLSDDGVTCNKVKEMNGNLENDVIYLSQNSEIHQNGKCMLEKHQQTQTNLSDAQSEDTKPQAVDACHGPSVCPTLSNQNLDSSHGECDSDKGGSAEDSLSPVKLESELSEEEEVKSENLKVKRDATKSILLDKAPSILTIHLKRFSQDARGRLSKLNGHVNFRETIDLKPYMDPRCTEKGVFTYRLVGVVEHLGTMRGGHYVAYVRGTKNGGDSTWYHASDAHVREASLEEVLRCEAYILFYEGT